MASTYTDLLKFNKPGLGDTGWGTAVNSGFTDMAEQALTGVVSKAVTVAGPNTLAAIASGASSEARNQFILLTGTLASPASLTVPAGTATNYKLYFVKNTAGDAVTITDGVSGVVVPNGKSMVLRVTSTGVEEAVNHAITLSVGTLTLTNALGATAGGTGQTVYAVGDLLYANTTTTLSKLTAGATNAVLTVAAGIPAWVTTLPVASGGTGAATLTLNNVLLGNGTSAVQAVAPGTAGNVLTSAGGTWTSAALPVAGVNADVKTSGSGSFTIPANVTKLKVTIVGGGGGSAGSAVGNAGGGGGGGGTAVKWLTGLTPLNTINYAVGSGGAAGSVTPTSGGAGNPSSISSGTQSITTVTANGGGAGLTGGGVGAGGTATNGDLNMPGSTPDNGSNGGASIYSNIQSAQGASVANAGLNYGGGASSISGANAGAAGAAGVVIFEW